MRKKRESYDRVEEEFIVIKELKWVDRKPSIEEWNNDMSVDEKIDFILEITQEGGEVDWHERKWVGDEKIDKIPYYEENRLVDSGFMGGYGIYIPVNEKLVFWGDYLLDEEIIETIYQRSKDMPIWVNRIVHRYEFAIMSFAGNYKFFSRFAGLKPDGTKKLIVTFGKNDINWERLYGSGVAWLNKLSWHNGRILHVRGFIEAYKSGRGISEVDWERAQYPLQAKDYLSTLPSPIVGKRHYILGEDGEARAYMIDEVHDRKEYFQKTWNFDIDNETELEIENIYSINRNDIKGATCSLNTPQPILDWIIHNRKCTGSENIFKRRGLYTFEKLKKIFMESDDITQSTILGSMFENDEFLDWALPIAKPAVIKEAVNFCNDYIPTKISNKFFKYGFEKGTSCRVDIEKPQLKYFFRDFLIQFANDHKEQRRVFNVIGRGVLPYEFFDFAMSTCKKKIGFDIKSAYFLYEEDNMYALLCGCGHRYKSFDRGFWYYQTAFAELGGKLISHSLVGKFTFNSFKMRTTQEDRFMFLGGYYRGDEPLVVVARNEFLIGFLTGGFKQNWDDSLKLEEFIDDIQGRSDTFNDEVREALEKVNALKRVYTEIKIEAKPKKIKKSLTSVISGFLKRILN